MREVKTIGVIGAGQIGAGVAQVCLQRGYAVVLYDVAEGILQRSRSELEGSFSRRVQRGDLEAAKKEEMLSRLTTTTDLSQVKDVDIISEAAPEVPALKLRVFAELDKICAPHTIFSSNSSSIPITQMASATKRPDRFIGVRYMHPVVVLRTCEIVRGYITSDETFAAADAWAKSLGKEVSYARDYAGHGNDYWVRRHREQLLQRIPQYNQLLFELMEGVKTPQEVENVQLEESGGMGPLAWMDLVGLDTMVHILDVCYEEWRQPQFVPCPLLRRLVEAGHLGQKTGLGFYDYSKTPRRATTLSPAFLRFVAP